MMQAIFQYLVNAAAVSCVSILSVYALRWIARKAVNARLAYAAWALVPLMLCALALPRPVEYWEISVPALSSAGAVSLPSAPVGTPYADATFGQMRCAR